MLDKMLLIRHFEERAQEMYMKAKIGGFLHLAVGEEATIVGTTSVLRGEDYLMSTYREHGQALARGTDPGRGDGRAVRQADRRLGRPRRLDAPVRRRAALHGRLRHRRRQPAAGGRHGARLRLPRRRVGDGLHVRRRRLQSGHLRRNHEPGGALEAAGRLPGRQQPVRHGHGALAPLGGHRPVEQGGVLRRSRRAGRRHGRAGRARVRRRAPATRPRGPPADAGRVADLPLPRPLGLRPRGLQNQGGGRAVARARPDRAATGASSNRPGCWARATTSAATPRRSRSSIGPSSSPTRAPTRRSSRSTTTSTRSATSCRAGTRSTSARPRCTAASTSATSARTGVPAELAEAGAAHADSDEFPAERRGSREDQEAEREQQGLPRDQDGAGA